MRTKFDIYVFIMPDESLERFVPFKLYIPTYAERDRISPTQQNLFMYKAWTTHIYVACLLSTNVYRSLLVMTFVSLYILIKFPSA